MRIKEISKNNRPRERLAAQGAEALSDAELLSVILQKGTKEENIIDISNKMLNQHGLEGLSKLSFRELQKIKGIGAAKAAQIKTIFELGKRFSLPGIKKKTINSAKDVFNYFKTRLSALEKEYFIVLHMDSKNKILNEEIVSIGTLTSSLIHPREIFKLAIRESANSIILVHNHPSGDPSPSEEDRQITDLLSDAGKMLGIQVLDHVIIGKTYYSFADSA